MKHAVLGDSRLALATAMCILNGWYNDEERFEFMLCPSTEKVFQAVSEGNSPYPDEMWLGAQFKAAKDNQAFSLSYSHKKEWVDSDVIWIFHNEDVNWKHTGADIEGLLDIVNKYWEKKEKGIVVIRDDMPPGCTSYLSSKFPKLDVVYMPNFATFGNMLKETRYPEKVVFGYDGYDKPKPYEDEVSVVEAKVKYFGLHRPFTCPVFYTTYEMAERIKLLNNSLLAARLVTLNNHVAALIENNRSPSIPAKVSTLITAVGTDTRIGHSYLSPSFAVGGGLTLSMDFQDAFTESLNLEDANLTTICYWAKRIAECAKKVGTTNVLLYGAGFNEITDSNLCNPIKTLIDILQTEHKLVVFDNEATMESGVVVVCRRHVWNKMSVEGIESSPQCLQLLDLTFSQAEC